MIGFDEFGENEGRDERRERKEGREGGWKDTLPSWRADAMMGYSKEVAVCMPGGEPSPAHTLISHVQV